MNKTEKEIIKDRINAYIKDNLSKLIDLSMEICRIPSPTGYEGEKSAFLLNRLVKSGDVEANIDEAGNVICIYNGSKGQSGKLTAVTAHIDTVFPRETDIKPQIKGNRIYAPSIIDNSVNVASLVFIIEMLGKLDIILPKGILFAFNVGEEGLGNLKGMRFIMDNRKNMIDAVVAVDGGYDTVVDKAVGSRRYSLRIKTEGGHSWKNFGRENAIVHAAKIVNKIYEIKVPENPKTTYNVGLIKGGISVNTIAQNAEILLDFRSESKECLERLVSDYEKIVCEIKTGYESSPKGKVEIESMLLGERPCGVEFNNPLPGLIEKIRKEKGINTRFESGSTDANIPLSMGIPAISFGVGIGAGMHTKEEYLELDSLRTGLEILASFILELSYTGVIL